MPNETAELYESDKYQRTNDIESRVSHGLPIEERNEFEVDQSLEALNIDFKEGDRILDLACGTGGHARLLRDKLGVNIDARDFSAPSIKKAKEIEDSILSTRDSIRGQISFWEGDYGNLKESNLPENVKYKLVSILGSSFMYLKTAEDHQRAMNDFYDLLEDGGRIVIQFRDKEGRKADDEKMAEVQKKLNVVYEEKQISLNDRPDAFGKSARDYLRESNAKKEAEAKAKAKKEGKKFEPQTTMPIYILRDTKEGDSFYYYAFEYDLPSASDGTPRHGFRKAYIDKDGNEEDMEGTTTVDYVERKNFDKLKALMEKAGFKNVKISGKPISPDGATISYVVVGEKV